MKKKSLLIAGCLAASAPTVSIADVLPKNFVGMNLGEISTSSFLNQPFKGVIPFLFTSYENSKKLTINLASESVFSKVGAEKHPILDSLNFQVAQQNNKAVILISSDRPIQLPFLNFVLEIQSPEGVIYQDYTVLLDPASKQVVELEAKYIDNPNTDYAADIQKQISTLQLPNLSSKITSTTSKTLKYKVKAGDSLSKIAQKHRDYNNYSLQTLSLLIYQKNPRAFNRNDINNIKKGAVITLPTTAEMKGFEIAKKNHKTIKAPVIKVIPKATETSTYTVVKGDSLSKIAKKFAINGESYSKLMNDIYTSNPDAFLNRNLIKAGAEISIPEMHSSQTKPQLSAIKQEKPNIKNVTDLDVHQYKVKDGDTLYSITKKMGFEGTDFGKMQKAIFVNNSNAFVSGNINQLEIGSVITLPIIDKAVQATQKSHSKTKNISQAKTVTNKITNINTAEHSDLSKRIRELRKELNQSKNNLSVMKKSLRQKESLLSQKNSQVDLLNTALVELRSDVEAGALSSKAVKMAIEKETNVSEKLNYKPISAVGMASLKSDLEHKKMQTQALLNRAEEIKSHKMYLDTADSSMLSVLPIIKDLTKANMAYLSSALFLGLLLIRYRRELYALTYSTINFDQPKYYPAPEVGTYELKERNINYYDSIMDGDLKNYESVASKQDTDLGGPEVSDEKNQVKINPLLVEATSDIFEVINETAEVKKCENLVTELIDVFDIKEDKKIDEEWQEIEKVCNNYTKKAKSAALTKKENEDGTLIEGATDLNVMMSDLVESLNKVDKTVKDNKIARATYPVLYKNKKSHAADNQENT